MNINRMITGLNTVCKGCSRTCEHQECLAPQFLAAKTFPQLFFLEAWYRREVGEIPPVSDDVRHDIESCGELRLLTACQSYLGNIAHARESGMIDDATLARMLPPAIHYLRAVSGALQEMPDMSHPRMPQVEAGDDVSLTALLAS